MIGVRKMETDRFNNPETMGEEAGDYAIAYALNEISDDIVKNLEPYLKACKTSMEKDEILRRFSKGLSAKIEEWLAITINDE